MLVAFLIQNVTEWNEWKQAIQELPGTPILHIANGEPPSDSFTEREDALEEVEAFDDEDMEGEAEVIVKPDTQEA